MVANVESRGDGGLIAAMADKGRIGARAQHKTQRIQ
jgi:hypothetical protein